MQVPRNFFGGPVTCRNFHWKAGVYPPLEDEAALAAVAAGGERDVRRTFARRAASILEDVAAV